MKKHNFIQMLFLLPVLLLAGCETPMDDHGDEASPRTFTATIDGSEPATRTLLENAAATAPRAVLWKVDDEVKIGDGLYTAGSLSNGDKTAVLTGSGATKSGDVYKGYYPKDIYVNYASATRVNLQQTQTYEVDGDRMVAANLPMYAECEGTTLNFKNLCAVLSLKLTGTRKVTGIEVSSASKQMCNYFTVDWNGGNPTLEPVYPTSYRYVRLNCTGAPGGGVQLSDTPVEFCIAVPPGTYPQGDLTVTAYSVNYSSGYVIAAYKNQNAPAGGSVLQRNRIYDLTKETDWIEIGATTEGHSVGGNYADGTTTNLNSTWGKE